MRLFKFSITLFALAVLALSQFACREQSREGSPDTPVSATKAPTVALESGVDAAGVEAALHNLFESHFERYLELNPTFATYIGDSRYNDRYANDIGPEWRAASQRLETESLESARAIDSTVLQGQDLLSLEIFIADREIALEGFGFPEHLMPINQFYSAPNSFVQMGSGTGTHPFKMVKDYDDFLRRIDGFVTWMEQAKTNMREGMTDGITPPRILMERVLPQLESQLVSQIEDSSFYQPIVNLPENFSAEDRERLTTAYVDAIGQKLIPAYRGMLEFIRDEYIPATLESHGMDKLPNGPA